MVTDSSSHKARFAGRQWSLAELTAFYEEHGTFPFKMAGGATNSVTDRTDAGALIPENAAREIIQSVEEQSAVLQLARRWPDMPTNQTRIPVVQSNPTAFFVNGDTGLKQTTDMAWTNVYLNAEELAVIVPVPVNVVRDSPYNITEQMRPKIIEAFGVALDAAVVFGTNKPASWPASVRAGAVAAGNSVALGTGADVYDDIFGESGVYAKVEQDGYDVTGTVAAVALKAKLRGLRDANGQPIFMTSMQDRTRFELDGTPIFFPKNGAFDTSATWLVTGQWDQLIYSMRQEIEMTMADQGVITDNAGNIIFNLFQQDMIAYRFTMRIAFALPNPINRLNSNGSTRFPFSVLTT